MAGMTKEQAIEEFKREGMIIPESAVELAISDMEKIEKIKQIVNEWNNDASHSFSDMCKLNKILKE